MTTNFNADNAKRFRYKTEGNARLRYPGKRDDNGKESMRIKR